MKNIRLHASWHINAPVSEVFALMTDFEHFPEYFPKVANSLRIVRREGDVLEIEATAKSFGRQFPVTMHTRILPGRGYISDNVSPAFGTSGHEELILSADREGTVIDYTYQVAIHKWWLRILAKPLIGWYSMTYWEKAVIDVLRAKLQK